MGVAAVVKAVGLIVIGAGIVQREGNVTSLDGNGLIPPCQLNAALRVHSTGPGPASVAGSAAVAGAAAIAGPAAIAGLAAVVAGAVPFHGDVDGCRVLIARVLVAGAVGAMDIRDGTAGRCIGIIQLQGLPGVRRKVKGKNVPRTGADLGVVTVVKAVGLIVIGAGIVQ